ncbi:MAG TPA: beta-ketoacyl synthase chain length factor [Streptosporangiaceae bacterium]
MSAHAVLRQAGADPGAAQGALADGTTVLARAHWPAGQVQSLPAVAGFVVSAFSPLAAALADLCLTSYFGDPPGDPALGERTAIVLASGTGDLPTAAAVASAVTEGRRVPPLLFYQSNPNAVAGHIAARWGLAGPVTCTVSAADPLAEAMSDAALLIADGAAHAALVIVANAYAGGDADGDALLIGPVAWPPASRPPATGAAPS